MEKNGTLLGKREVKDNIIECRATFVDNWKRELNQI
jgi:hypothetical protein